MRSFAIEHPNVGADFVPVEREIPHGALHEPAPPGQCLDNKGFVPRSTCAVCLTVQSHHVDV